MPDYTIIAKNEAVGRRLIPIVENSRRLTIADTALLAAAVASVGNALAAVGFGLPNGEKQAHKRLDALDELLDRLESGEVDEDD